MKVIFAKFNRDRLHKFQIATKILMDNEGNKFVIKEALNEKAETHIKQILKNYKLLTENFKIRVSEPIKIEKKRILFNFIIGESFEKLLIRSIESGNEKEFDILLNIFLEYVNQFVTHKNEEFHPCDKFLKIFGEWYDKSPQDIVTISNVDLNFSNLILDRKKEIILIDYEWIFNFPVPKDFIIWRPFYFFNKYHIKPHKIKFNYINKLPIDINDERFLIMEKNFSNFIFGNHNFFLPYRKKTHHFINPPIENNIFSQLFINFGYGFNENSSVKIPLKTTDTTYFFKFRIPANVFNLRFDPINDYCIVLLEDIFLEENNGRKINLIDKISTNALFYEKNIFFFHTNDPQIYFKDIKFNNISNLYIKLKFLKIGKEALVYIINKIIYGK